MVPNPILVVLNMVGTLSFSARLYTESKGNESTIAFAGYSDTLPTKLLVMPHKHSLQFKHLNSIDPKDTKWLCMNNYKWRASLPLEEIGKCPKVAQKYD